MARPAATPDPGILRRHGWLTEQPASFADAVLAKGWLRHFRAREPVQYDGDPAGGIYGIVTGGIAIYGSRPDGVPTLAHIQRPGQWLGQGPLLGTGQRTLTFVAAEDSLVLCVPLAALREIGRASPEGSAALGRLGELAAQQANQVITELLLPRAEQRIAAVLLRVTRVLERQDGDVPDNFMMTQSDIGEMANTSRNHVNRTLQRFRDAGWVTVRYNRIGITDPQALKAFIETSGSGII